MTISKRSRFEVLKRDGFKCFYCGNTADEKPLTIDHVVPVALGGSDDVTNLVAACPDCNSGKSSVMPGAELIARVNVEVEIAKAAQNELMKELTATMLAEDAYETSVWELWDFYAPSYARARLRTSMKAVTYIYDWHARGVPLTVIEKGVRIAVGADVPWSAKWNYAAGVVRNTIGAAEAVVTNATARDEGYSDGFEDASDFYRAGFQSMDLIRHHVDGTSSAWIDAICRVRSA